MGGLDDLAAVGRGLGDVGGLQLHRPVDVLAEAADTAQSPFTDPASNEVAADAMAEERQLFRTALQGWVTQADMRVEPLAYRRVLTPTESAKRQEELQQR